MDTRHKYARVLLVVGLAILLIGMVDPLEGAIFTLIGVGVLAIASALIASQYTNLLTWAVWFVSAGISVMIVLSWMGGVGGTSGHSAGWLLLVLPYPIGLVFALVGGVGALEETWTHRRTPSKGTK